MSDHDIVLKRTVCAILSDVGFDSAQGSALEILTELLQKFLIELGQKVKSYYELAGRTEPLGADVIMALVDKEIRLKVLSSIHHPKISFPPISTLPAIKQQPVLQTGSKQNLPPFVPSHLPQLPDPHAYIRSSTHKKPISEYEAIREKVAVQKRDLERSLNKFLTKSRKTESLFFNQENDLFTLVAATVSFPPYLTALLPKDQVYDGEEQDENSTPTPKKNKNKNAPNTMEEGEGEKSTEVVENESSENSENTENVTFVNPFLRPSKVPPGFFNNNNYDLIPTEQLLNSHNL